MLTFLRDSAKSGVLKFFLIGFMALAVVGLVFIDMTGSFRDGVSSNSVARVGDSEISTGQMMNNLQNMERQSGLPEVPQQLRLRMAKEAVDTEVRRRVLLLEAQDMGLNVPDTYAARQIKAQLTPLVEGGFTEQEALAQLLRNTGMGEDQLMQAFKQDVAVQLLLSAITAGKYAPNEVIETAYSYENQTRSAAVVSLRPASFPSPATAVDEEELKTYYRNNQSKYMTPEYREISYLIFDESKMPQAPEISEDTLRSEYESRVDEFTLPPRRITDQAIFQSSDRAQEFVGAINAPQDFNVKLQGFDGEDYLLLSDEPVSEEDLVEDIVDAAFDTPIGEVTGPIETSLGWIVMYVKSEQDEQVQDFSEIREELKTEMTQDDEAARFYDTVNEIDDMLATSTPLSDIADEFNLNVYQTPMITADGKTESDNSAELLQNDYAAQLLEKSFAIKQGEESPLMETDNGKFIAYTASQVNPPQAKPFETVRAQVTKDYNKDKLWERMENAAQSLEDEVANGKLLTDLVKANAYPLKKIGPVTGTQAMENKDISENITKTIFQFKKPGDIQAIKTANGYDVVMLTAVTFPQGFDMSDDQRAKYKDEISSRLQNDMLNQYEMALRKKYDVEISNNAIERALRPTDFE